MAVKKVPNLTESQRNAIGKLKAGSTNNAVARYKAKTGKAYDKYASKIVKAAEITNSSARRRANKSATKKYSRAYKSATKQLNQSIRKTARVQAAKVNVSKRAPKMSDATTNLANKHVANGVTPRAVAQASAQWKTKTGAAYKKYSKKIEKAASTSNARLRRARTKSANVSYRKTTRKAGKNLNTALRTYDRVAKVRSQIKKARS